MTASLEQQIQALQVRPGTAAMVWLGQASFLLKSPEGVIVMIDPYLTDWGETQWGMKRVIPPPIDPAKIMPDLLLITHWHEDHLDAPLIKQWAAQGPAGHFVGPLTCTVRASAWGWPPDQVHQLETGGEFRERDVTVRPTFARHHVPMAPAGDEIGFLIDIGNVRIWNVGDTEYDARLRAMKDESIDVAFVPINGVGGNMNAEEAALLMKTVSPRVAIPMHYNMWDPATFGPDATLDPAEFAAFLTLIGGTAHVENPAVGDIVLLQ